MFDNMPNKKHETNRTIFIENPTEQTIKDHNTIARENAYKAIDLSDAFIVFSVKDTTENGRELRVISSIQNKYYLFITAALLDFAAKIMEISKNEKS